MPRARTTHFERRVVFGAGLADGLADGLARAGADLETAGLALGAGRGLTASFSVGFLCSRNLELAFSTGEKRLDVLWESCALLVGARLFGRFAGRRGGFRAS